MISVRVLDVQQFSKRICGLRGEGGEVQVLTNMDILTEGFDAQACSCVIMLRPTQSWSLFTQMVGRGLRVLPGLIDGIGTPAERREAVRGSAKADCIVIDIVSNTSLHNVADRPKDGETPSLQGLVGLPSALDLEGLTLAEAVEEFEQLPELVKAAAFRRKTSFSGLSATLTQVEMLSELSIPEEAEDAGARLYWLKVADLEYMLDIGTGVGSMIRRVARLVGDIVGHWTLHIQSWDGDRLLRDEDVPGHRPARQARGGRRGGISDGERVRGAGQRGQHGPPERFTFDAAEPQRAGQGGGRLCQLEPAI
jgi:hypothetical protein